MLMFKPGLEYIHVYNVISIQQTIITDAIGHGCNNFMQSEIAVAGFFGGDDTKN